uniref:Uncharacterized protein n=1 Tax=Chromera velia CCMP2878 TaxID=1169474 RepID=A0A0G4F032_9ALVE|eukprot:Cvel_14450.t1-p1 / transcript=Cvel_14450.t1 / gene=Cvel_14450 / organism=Chromera_velia_CCMP2878 / gene_product=hypothetical protein / transcript_product=hypothetical protein / location=Cvel_scaffold1028:57301-59221(-) / protein_length=284 / sequence_SO=supercontig / SO=protein_coding / is_pseudo=false
MLRLTTGGIYAASAFCASRAVVPFIEEVTLPTVFEKDMLSSTEARAVQPDGDADLNGDTNAGAAPSRKQLFRDAASHFMRRGNPFKTIPHLHVWHQENTNRASMEHHPESIPPHSESGERDEEPHPPPDTHAKTYAEDLEAQSGVEEPLQVPSVSRPANDPAVASSTPSPSHAENPNRLSVYYPQIDAEDEPVAATSGMSGRKTITGQAKHVGFAPTLLKNDRRSQASAAKSSGSSSGSLYLLPTTPSNHADQSDPVAAWQRKATVRFVEETMRRVTLRRLPDY